MNQKQICCINCYPREHTNEVGCQRIDCQCHQKQSWEEKVHLKLLEKSESAKDCGEMTVVKIGFLPAIIKEIVDEAIQTREREVREEYENNKHFVLPPAIQVDLSDMEMIKCCDIAVARREREISEEVGKKSSNGVVDSHAWIFVKEVLSIINNK